MARSWQDGFVKAFSDDLRVRFLFGPGSDNPGSHVVLQGKDNPEIKVTVEKTVSWLRTIDPICRAYLNDQATRQELFERVHVLRWTF